MTGTELTGQDAGTVHSGDVELFYRRFGVGGGEGCRRPILILHGAGYYDSADWIDVASELASEAREVVAFDARGYGRSEWSPSADYSLDAQLADITALLDHLGWEKPVLLGHSRGGAFTLRFVSAHPERVGAVIFADSCPGRTARGRAPAGGTRAAAGGPADPVHATLAEALASTSRDPSSLQDPSKRARLEQIFMPVEGGGRRLALRDPQFQQGGSGGPFDGWAALAGLKVPTLIIRATRSLAFDEAAVARVRNEVPHASYIELDSGHDLANQAPAEFVAAVRRFLA
jgi:pimeloyl-ACP methyl ester carboxylesterase